MIKNPSLVVLLAAFNEIKWIEKQVNFILNQKMLILIFMHVINLSN